MSDKKIIKFPNTINGAGYIKQFRKDLVLLVFIVFGISFGMTFFVFNMLFSVVLSGASCFFAANLYNANGVEYPRSFIKHSLINRGNPIATSSYRKYFRLKTDRGVPSGYFIDSSETLFRD